jgi:hypothetical protein
MESQDSSIPYVLTIQDAFFIEPERAPENGSYQTHDGTEHWRNCYQENLVYIYQKESAGGKPGWNVERKFC